LMFWGATGTQKTKKSVLYSVHVASQVVVWCGVVWCRVNRLCAWHIDKVFKKGHFLN